MTEVSGGQGKAHGRAPDMAWEHGGIAAGGRIEAGGAKPAR